MELRDEQGIAVADADVELLAKIIELWPPFDTGLLVAEARRLYEDGLCAFCGGWRTQPLWAHSAFESGFSIELYGSPGAQVATACIGCIRATPPGLSFDSRDATSQCVVCHGSGFAPNWVLNFLNMPCMAINHLTRTGLWFAVPCGACGGWGKQFESTRDHMGDVAHQEDTDELLRFDGTQWEFRFEGRAVTLANTVGMRHIGHLIGSPGRSFTAMQLSAIVNALHTAAPLLPASEGLKVRESTGDGGQMIDDEAVRQFRARLDELADRIAEAERNNDLGRLEKLKSEREAIEDELLRSTGLGGRPRPMSDDSERARKAVSKAIRDVLRRIAKEDPELGKYLEAGLRLGHDCVFVLPAK